MQQIRNRLKYQATATYERTQLKWLVVQVKNKNELTRVSLPHYPTRSMQSNIKKKSYREMARYQKLCRVDAPDIDQVPQVYHSILD